MNSSAADGPSSPPPRLAPLRADLNQEDNGVVLPKEEVTVPRLKSSRIPPSIADDARIEAIVSTTHGQYNRTRLSDGSFRPETYIFSKPTPPSGVRADPSLDRVSWTVLTAKISSALAQQNYFLAEAPSSAQLRIEIQWGSSELFSDPPHFPTLVALPSLTKIQEESNARGAEAPRAASRIKLSFGKSNWAREDINGKALTRELVEGQPQTTSNPAQENLDNSQRVGFPHQTARYFVVVSAFENASKTARIPLWETHFSVPVKGNWFDEQLSALAFTASDFFGKDTRAIVMRRLLDGTSTHPASGSNVSATRLAERRVALAPDGTHVAFLRELTHALQILVVSVASPERLSMGEIVQNADTPPDIRWEDSAHVLIAKNPSTWVRFDLARKRAELVEADPQSAFENFDQKDRLVSFGEVKKIAEEKLPDREVTLLGADNAAQRFLLLASPKTGLGRYFVLDRPSDLLYEVGREDVGREELRR